MKFKDYTQTRMIYHIANINDFNNILKDGIKFNDKVSYKTKYIDFHKLIDQYKLSYLPEWIIRQKAIFGSMNFKDKHTWHSHSVLLGLKVNEDYCWVANENLVNEIYEPFILKDIDEFSYMNKYIKRIGINNIKEYWKTSLSFKENLSKRLDKKEGYDCEVLIFHDIKPKDITPIAIVSDHRYIEYDDIKRNYLNEGE
ncbi:hypothetical protein GOQ27_06055 [Clostridium sp. D2Q-11]|uniref:DarT domain-containing protein n=1 Tax=Anaeromonas frigoriresistens TaxID=2683708 RepID=A0A942UW67_9FIRM|nr:hypothetical protein [Anaeromonas frigoriresistens]MBS4538016.1 hypothetical protein [Anaeromonas frigoriresistens]